MSNKEQYFAMAQGEAEPAISEIYGFSATPLSIVSLEDQLKKQRIFTDIDIDYDEDDEHSFMLRCSAGEERLLFRVVVQEQDPATANFIPYYATDPISPQLIAQANTAPSIVCVESMFTVEPLANFCYQLQLLQLLVPSFLVGIDESAGGRVFTKEWLNFQLEQDVLPSVDSLYVIHAIYDSEEDPPSKFWFHTHGLLRCGIPEVDLIFPHLLGDYYGIDSLIHAFVGKCLNEGKVIFNEPVVCGQTEEAYQYLVALPFEEGIRHIQQKTLISDLPDLKDMHFDLEGAPEGEFLGDKADRDEYHQHPSCVLFKTTEEEQVMETFFAGYGENKSIVFYRPNSETDMMSRKAQLRWSYFTNLFAEYGQPKKTGFLGKLLNSKKSSSEFSFMIKCGIVVEEDDGREHMWFVPKEMDDQQFQGELINSPFFVKDMQQGQLYSLTKEQVTDWAIYHEGEQYTPDSIYKLLSPKNVH